MQPKSIVALSVASVLFIILIFVASIVFIVSLGEEELSEDSAKTMAILMVIAFAVYMSIFIWIPVILLWGFARLNAPRAAGQGIYAPSWTGPHTTVQCPHCGSYAWAGTAVCPHCGGSLLQV